MHRKYLFPIIAIMGALFGLLTVYSSQKKIPPLPILFPPALSPFVNSIAGSGIIECSSENIAIGCPFNEIVTTIYVSEGDTVEKGAPLFEVDIRELEAKLAFAEAQVEVARVAVANQKEQFSFYQRLKDTKAASEKVFHEAHFSLLTAEEELKSQESSLNQIKVNLKRSKILAPINGEILKVNIRLGEIASNQRLNSNPSDSLILMGAFNPLELRVDIDEDDAWRFEKGSKAQAYVRGNRNLSMSLKYVRTKPFIIPKSTFTGDTAERVDTRVLQVIYHFDRNNLPVYIGQILDVFIESKSMDDLLK